MTDLSQNLANASQNDTDSSLLRSILRKLPIGLGESDDEDKVSQADAMKEKAKAYQFNPDDVMPPEVQTQLLALVKWRDDIYRDILKKIEMIPGLEGLIDALTNALNACESSDSSSPALTLKEMSRSRLYHLGTVLDGMFFFAYVIADQ